MTRRGGEGHALLWVGLGCGGAFLALLVLVGGVTALWALGYLGHRRPADSASSPATSNLPVPFVPAGNPFAPVRPAGGRLTLANCEKLKSGMTEAEVRATLGPPAKEHQLVDPRATAGMPAEMADQFLAKELTFRDGTGELQVSVRVSGRIILATGMVEGKAIFVTPRAKNPFAPPGAPPRR